MNLTILLMIIGLLYSSSFSSLVRQKGHIDRVQQKNILSLHSDPEDFTASTWMIFVNSSSSKPLKKLEKQHKTRIGEEAHIDWDDDKIFIKLQSFLTKDGCILLNSTVADTQIAFKVYCTPIVDSNKTERVIKDDNVTEKVIKTKTKKQVTAKPEDVLKNTLNGFIYKLFNKKHIQLENNKPFRRPHFFYGNMDILDYAIKLDSGTLDNEGITELKMPRSEVYEKIKRDNFFSTPVGWGLDRIDQRVGMLDSTYQFIDKAIDIDVYVVDTGIRVTHAEFEGRASFLINTAGDNIDTDCAGIYLFNIIQILTLSYTSYFFFLFSFYN